MYPDPHESLHDEGPRLTPKDNRNAWRLRPPGIPAGLESCTTLLRRSVVLAVVIGVVAVSLYLSNITYLNFDPERLIFDTAVKYERS